MSVPQEKVAELLAAGIGPAAIAQAYSCTPSYVSQLQEDPRMQALVAQAKMKRAAKEVETDHALTDIRGTLVKRLGEMAPHITKVADVVRALEVVDKMEARKQLAGQQTRGPAQVVQLVLPKRAKIQFTLNQASEVIEVEGRALASMPAHQISALAARPMIERIDVEDM